MGFIKKIFGEKPARHSEPASSQFHESETTTEQGSKNAPRRELVQVVLRETMRRHGIPSDWIECRILSVVSRSALPGMHVTLVVRQGHDRLLSYVPAFQTSLLHAIAKFEPKSAEWLLSLSWQFEGMSGHAQMPEPGSWRGAAAAGAATAAASAVAAAPAAEPSHDDEMEEDLKALYAIRDAAMAQDAGRAPDGQADFQHTQPSE